MQRRFLQHMRALRKAVLGAALLLAALPARGAGQPGERRFYLYGGAAVNWFRHLEYSFTSGESVSPLLGAGWCAARFEDRLRVNLSLDHAPAVFRFPFAGRQRIGLTTLMAEVEWRLLHPRQLSLYAGVGGGWIRYSANRDWPEGYFLHEPGDAETFTVVAFELGFKHAVLPARRLLLRCGLRVQGEAGGDEYWDDWSGEWGTTAFNRLNTQLLVGLEFRL